MELLLLANCEFKYLAAFKKKSVPCQSAVIYQVSRAGRKPKTSRAATLSSELEPCLLHWWNSIAVI
jgi:hypothetical protein